MLGHELKDDLKTCGVKVVDSIYHASVYSVFAYNLLLLLLAIIGVAVFLRLVDVPEFHPR